MRTNNVTIKLGGEAGSGIATIGTIFSKLMQRAGLHVFSTNDYPSLIRGGHNTITIRASSEPIHALHGPIDVLVALDINTIKLHQDEVAPGGAVLYDSTTIKEAALASLNPRAVKLPHTVPTDAAAAAQPAPFRDDLLRLPVPLTQYAREAGGDLYFNQVAAGAALALLGMDIALLYAMIERTFGRKGPEVVASNKKAAQAGYDHIQKEMASPFGIAIRPRPPERTLFINSNDAVCLGAVAAGVRLVAEYPMSPSSSILHWMAAHAVKYDIVVKHTEDEIAAMNWLCGAGFAGVRAMTATSGGGFSLMVEALGNAGIAEIPCVVVNDMRAGPSTGLPTYTDQSDLRFALHASQGEFPRIVACPGDPEEAFHTAFDVFNMAEQVQTPAIILLDKYMGESAATIPRYDVSKLRIERGLLQTDAQMEKASHFKRHALTPSGISPRCIPGQKNGIHVCSSYEHDETGYTSEEADMRVQQLDKRARKMAQINPALYQPVFFGDPKSTFLLVVWGSTKGPALEALKLLAADNIHIRLMHIRYALPFATEAVKHALQAASTALICEANSEGQMRYYIREKTGILIPEAYLRYDARPFEPGDIAQKVRDLLKK